ncbi:MAG TPA: NAD(+) diphosphatase [Thermodesulfobacteriota bacterium]|nr:NAD(+) diphosphatase [Thermodesulfobacteriota bacterium]
MNSNFIPEVVPPAAKTEPAWWFAFRQSELLLYEDPSGSRIPRLTDFAELGVPSESEHYLGRIDGAPVYAVGLPEGKPAPQGMAFEGLRKVYGSVDEDLFWLAARAVQIVEWDRTHRFCGRCATPLVPRAAERAKECPQCHLLQFPRLAPAVIVLVERGRELLMARSRHFAPGVYSVLAGFVEPGETLEEAVEREVFEETGIRIRDIRYFGSQPWPFPHSLMIGFTARYASGELKINPEEIEDAGWFTADTMPGQPGKISIARRLIEWFKEKAKNDSC